MQGVTVDRIAHIGVFKPRRRHITEAQWAMFARSHAPHGLFLYGPPELRQPSAAVDDDVREWHHDLSEEVRDRTWLMVWSNMRPTQIKHVVDGKIVTPEPYNVVIFKNDRWLHRKPFLSLIERKRRYFGRAWFTYDEKLALSYLEDDL